MLSVNPMIEAISLLAFKEIELNFDSAMPEIYKGEDTGIYGWPAILGQVLNAEVSKHARSRCRVITKFKRPDQFIYIDIDARRLPDATTIQEHLDRIAKGETWPHSYSGNRMAANVLRRKYKGEMKLEIIDDPPYTVRTTIRVPASI